MGSAFPVCSVIIVLVAGAMGYWQVYPIHCAIVLQVIFFILVLAMIFYIAHLVFFLPNVLLRKLVFDLTDKRFLWQDGLELDVHELLLYFASSTRTDLGL